MLRALGLAQIGAALFVCLFLIVFLVSCLVETNESPQLTRNLTWQVISQTGDII